MQRVPLYVDQTGGLVDRASLPPAPGGSSARSGLDLLVIDYIQLLQGSSRRGAENRVQEITEITNQLKALAQGAAGSDPGAVAAFAAGREPRRQAPAALPTFANSGSIEQDADVVLFVFREEYYLKNKEPKPGTHRARDSGRTEMERRSHGVAEVIIGKQRHGPTGTVQLQFEDTAHPLLQSRARG